jgi:1-phosphatidylinositol-4-phosphate 5-kinase
MKSKKSSTLDGFDEVSQLDIKVCSYSHRVFESIRYANGFTAEQLEKSLDLEKNVSQIKKAKESLGASGSFFFFSFDNHLVIKTITEEEKDKMGEILPKYYEHFKYNEHSLISKIYGIFAV